MPFRQSSRRHAAGSHPQPRRLNWPAYLGAAFLSDPREDEEDEFDRVWALPMFAALLLCLWLGAIAFGVPS